ncbi:MAG: hypothetical protein ACRDPE_23550 [Solirubrobacterales bacterium]
MSVRDYQAQFRDPKTQGEIMLRLFLEERPLSFTELAKLIKVEPSVVAGNCAELRSKGWITRTEFEGRSRMELTVHGTDAVRRMHPSA